MHFSYRLVFCALKGYSVWSRIYVRFQATPVPILFSGGGQYPMSLYFGFKGTFSLAPVSDGTSLTHSSDRGRRLVQNPRNSDSE